MDFEALIREEKDGLTRRLARALHGDVDAAEDLRQEVLLRAWRSLPRDLHPLGQRAWLARTAGNLATDELRRRARKPIVPLGEAEELAASIDVEEPDAVREALTRLGPHERFLLLLRFHAGFAYGEIARLLDISEEAARKRVTRAKGTFVGAYRALLAQPQPLILLLARNESAVPYTQWLEHAGARVRQLNAHSERELALADGLVLTGAMDDLHPRLYGARPGPFLRGDLNAGKDRADLAVLVSALALDLPIVGVCRGHQLMNIASGGTLYQDVVVDGATRESHDFQHHPVTAYRGSETRRLVGRRRPQVWSEHHQAVRRLGRRLRIAASSPDGVIESIERTDRRFALGLQWHPEREFHDGPGGLVAEALVEAAAGRRAA